MKEMNYINRIGSEIQNGMSLASNGPLEALRSFWSDEEGVGSIEIVLILVVLIALIFIFRNRLTALIKRVFDAMDESAAELYGKES